MCVRELKLATASGIENDVNKFFDNLFNGLATYTLGKCHNIIYMKNKQIIMVHDIKDNSLRCVYSGFWKVLECEYNYSAREVMEIIEYKIEEKFSIVGIRVTLIFIKTIWKIQDGYRDGLLIPHKIS